LADQASKFLVLKYFPDIVSFNKGIAFGLLASDWWLIINFFILIAAFCLIKKDLALILIISGGASNILDRMIRGAVVDFIDFKIVPIFNFADFFICLGVVVLLLNMIYEVHAKDFSSTKKASL